MAAWSAVFALAGVDGFAAQMGTAASGGAASAILLGLVGWLLFLLAGPLLALATSLWSWPNRSPYGLHLLAALNAHVLMTVAAVPAALATAWIHMTPQGHMADHALVLVIMIAVSWHLASTHRALSEGKVRLLGVRMFGAVTLYIATIMALVVIPALIAG